MQFIYNIIKIIVNELGDYMSIPIIIKLVTIFIALAMTALFYKIIINNVNKNVIESICLVDNQIQIRLNENHQNKTINYFIDDIESFNIKLDHFIFNQLPTNMLGYAVCHNVEILIKFKNGNSNNIKSRISGTCAASFLQFCKSLKEIKLIPEIEPVSMQKEYQKRLLQYIIITIIFCIWIAYISKF